MRHIRILINASASASASATTTTKATFSPPIISQQQRSPWHSPVPYLFGGLAAMLGLIAFALLILACSYWRLSGRVDDRRGDDLENSNEKEGDAAGTGSNKFYEENFLVIMAGDQKPTFLATPVSSSASSLGDKNAKFEETTNKTENIQDKMKGGTIGNLDQTTTTSTTVAGENGDTQQHHP